MIKTPDEDGDEPRKTCLPGVLGGRWYPLRRGVDWDVVVAVVMEDGGGLIEGGPVGGPGCEGPPGLGEENVGVGWPLTIEVRTAGGPCGGLIGGPIGGPFMVGMPSLGGTADGDESGPGGLPAGDHAGGLAGGPWE